MSIKSQDLFYLDACATTPPLDSVIEEIARVQSDFWGNSSSIHSHGIKSATLLEKCRFSISHKTGLNPNQIIFTNGATQSIQIALHELASNFNKGRILLSPVEHPSVYDVVNTINNNKFDIKFLPVDQFGVIDLTSLEQLLSPPTKIISLIWGQSEIGTLQPIKIISDICKQRNIALHIDATQIFSQGNVILNELYFDFISLSAHKFRGPKGVGMLLANNKYTNNNSTLPSLVTRLYNKLGTTSVALISGMTKAFDELKSTITISNESTHFQPNKVSKLTNMIRSELICIPEIEFIGHPSKRLPHHISFLIKGNKDKPIYGRDIVRMLSNNGISASSGTACNSGLVKDSYVLAAIGIQKEFRQSGVRLSLGDWIQLNDIDKISCLIKNTILDSLNY